MANRAPGSVTARLVTAMLAAADRAQPHEACGLVITDRDGRRRFVELPNLAASPTRFVIDPVDLHRAIVEADRVGGSVTGYFHSHPGGPAAPSAVDLAEWPDSTWTGFIAGRRDDAWRVTAWRRTDDGEAVEVDIVAE